MSVLIKGMKMPASCLNCPYGRLIDADIAEEDMMYAMVMTGYQSMAMNVIRTASTIIESED